MISNKLDALAVSKKEEKGTSCGLAQKMYEAEYGIFYTKYQILKLFLKMEGPTWLDKKQATEKKLQNRDRSPLAILDAIRKSSQGDSNGYFKYQSWILKGTILDEGRIKLK